MRLRLFTEPQQGATYETLLRAARTAETLGFDAFFRSDHYLHMGQVSGLPGPTDAWITLAGLARDTSRIRLGTLVSPVTFRSPGQLAISVAQVDAMSDGRVELGLGTGWYGQEHEAYALPFPELSTRFAQLEEQLEIVTRLWATPEGERYSYEGQHYTIRDSPALPKPRQRPQPPIIIGGRGLRRTPRLVARYADEFNVAFPSLGDFGRSVAAGREACEAIGRDPATLTMSVALVVCCGSDEAEISRRARAIGRDVAELRANGAAGTPDEVADKLGAFADAGATRVYLQVLDLQDLDHLWLIAEDVAGWPRPPRAPMPEHRT